MSPVLLSGTPGRARRTTDKTADELLLLFDESEDVELLMFPPSMIE